MRLLAVGATALTAIAAAPVLLVLVLLMAITPTSINVATSATNTETGNLPAPTSFQGRDGGCTEPDPTSHGCLTPATRHALDQIFATFGQPSPMAPIHSVGCWDEHAWNPSSDHSRGRACDLFPGRAGQFAAGPELAAGWRLANWLRANAQALQVKYVIWQGRFWGPGKPDDG